jgi:outer membrane protein OmpA-like peptidoglycan-associated protein
MKIKSTLLNCGLALALTSGSLFAQEESAQEEKQSVLEKYPWMQNLYFSGSLGSNLAVTDIKQYNTWPTYRYSSEWSMGFSANWGYSISNTFAIEGGGFLGRGRGTDRSQALHFRSDIRDIFLGANVDLANLLFPRSNKEKRYTIYAKGGFGMAYFRGAAYQLAAENQYEAPVVRVVGYDDITMENSRFTRSGMLYTGGGIAYKISEKLDIYAETTVRFLNSDRLDAIKTGAEYDRYTYSALGLTYKLGNTKWVRPEEEFIGKLSVLDSIMDGFKDTDEDGVIDLVDKEANTVKGAKVYGDGTTFDTDADGVPDHLDQQLLSPCKEVNEYGVSLDSDEDGVADCLDIEPNTEKGAQVDAKGKKIDVKSENTVTNTKSFGFDPIFFGSNSSSLDADARKSLFLVAKYLKDNPNAKLEIVGHTDATGSNVINDKLGNARAKAISDQLVNVYGIDASRLSTVSKGDKEQIAKGKNAKENRRVDINIK